MAAITLTPQDGSASVVVNTNIIYRAFAYGTGSRVMYGKGGANPYIMDVTADPAAIADASLGLIEVTTTGGTEYIYSGNSANGDGKGIMMVNSDGSTGSVIFFKYTEQSDPIYIYSTDTPLVIAARINALTIFPSVATQSQTITASGALSTSIQISYLNTTSAAQALTLANGTVIGQVKYVSMTVFGAGNNAVLTPANLAGYTTITFNSVGDTVSLVWGGTAAGGWFIAGYSGVVIA
tara:strand:- start:476 stop:1186 length:711 start_codon:yes stop_codon:yes gene_type:complete